MPVSNQDHTSTYGLNKDYKPCGTTAFKGIAFNWFKHGLSLLSSLLIVFVLPVIPKKPSYFLRLNYP